MPAYQPFLVAGFKHGLYTGRDPWMTPQDAWPTLVNARINKGVLEKRQGYSELCQMNHGGVASTAHIIGLHHYLVGDTSRLLILDTARVGSYDANTATVTDLADAAGLGDIFSADSDEFFSVDQWMETAYMTNNSDGAYQYDGTDLSAFAPDMTGDADTLTRRKRFLPLKSRLGCFGPTYGATTYRTRLNWSDVLAPTFDDENYVNNPDCDQKPMVFERLENDKWVVWYEHELWEIRSTPDSANPFRWFFKHKGIRSWAPNVQMPMGVLGNGIVTLGDRHFNYYDGYKFKEIDMPIIRDVIDLIDQGKIEYCYGHYAPHDKRLLMTYVAAYSDASYPNRILEYSVDDQSWSTHIAPAHTLCSFDLGNGVWQTLFGGRDGKVYKWGDGYSDDGASIYMNAWSAAMNPFLKIARKARLLKIELLVETDAAGSLTAQFFKDLSPTPYKEQTVEFAGAGDKHHEVIWVGGEVGNFHRLRFVHDELDNRPRIHTMIWHFLPAGRLDRGGETSVGLPGGGLGHLWRYKINDDNELELQKFVGGVWTKKNLWAPNA